MEGRTSITHTVGEVPKPADDGGEIIHRDKVMAINSSGLSGVREEVLKL